MRILLTGVGCPGVAGTIKCLRDNPANEEVFILGVDMDKEAVGRFLCDRFQRVECPECADYIHTIQRLCGMFKIDIIIPQTTRETVILSDYKNMFKKQGVVVMVNDPDKVNLYNSKHTLLNMCECSNLPCVSYHIANNPGEFISLAYKMGYPFTPVVVKPLVGNGGRGVRILDKKSPDFKKYLEEKPDGMKTTLEDVVDIFHTAETWPKLLLMDYLPGKEYAVDVLSIPGKRVIIPRVRNKIRSGISFITEIVENDNITHQVNKLLDKQPLYGVFGFQFKESENGVPCVLESNPRIQGTMIAAYMAGVNIIWAAVEYYVYGEIKTEIPNKADPIKFFRYWGGVCETGGEIVTI